MCAPEHQRNACSTLPFPFFNSAPIARPRAGEARARGREKVERAWERLRTVGPRNPIQAPRGPLEHVRDNFHVWGVAHAPFSATGPKLGVVGALWGAGGAANGIAQTVGGYRACQVASACPSARCAGFPGFQLGTQRTSRIQSAQSVTPFFGDCALVGPARWTPRRSLIASSLF
jgi:hypothetical protein